MADQVDMNEIEAMFKNLPTAKPSAGDNNSDIDAMFADLPQQRSLGRKIYDNTQLGAEVAGGMIGGTLGAAVGGIPTAGAGSIPGAIAGGALGTAAANRAHKAVGTVLGYEQPQSLGDIAAETGIAGFRGALGEGMGQVASKIFSGFSNSVRSLFGGSQSGNAARMSSMDEAATNIDLTAAERSQSSAGLGFQRALSSVPGAKGVFAAKYEEQLTQAANALDNTITRLNGTRGVARDIAGDQSRVALNNLVDGMFSARSSQGRYDFGITDAMMNNRPYINVNNFTQTLQDEIAKLSYTGAHRGDVMRARHLTRMLNDVVSNQSTLTGFALNEHMAKFGKHAHSDGLFEGLSADAKDRAISARIASALDRDLNIAATQTNTMQGAVSDSLRTARDNWAVNSEVIQNFKDTAIGNYIGLPSTRDGTQVYNKIINLDPQQMQQAARYLDGVDPRLMNDVRTSYMEEFVTNASKGKMVNDQGALVETIVPGNFSNAVKTQRHKMRALIGDQGMADISAIGRQMDRIATGAKPNPWVGRVVMGGAGSITMFPALMGDYGTAARNAGIAAGVFLGARPLARILVEPAGRRALQQALGANTTRSQAIRSMSYLAAQAIEIDKEDAKNAAEGALKTLGGQEQPMTKPMNTVAAIRG
jgi:hypothetical protein